MRYVKQIFLYVQPLYTFIHSVVLLKVYYQIAFVHSRREDFILKCNECLKMRSSSSDFIVMVR